MIKAIKTQRFINIKRKSGFTDQMKTRTECERKKKKTIAREKSE